MKKSIFYMTVLFAVSLMFAGCNASYVKRHYMKGYYVEHKKRIHKTPVSTVPKHEMEAVVLEPKTMKLDATAAEPDLKGGSSEVAEGETAKNEQAEYNDKGDPGFAAMDADPSKTRYFKKKMHSLKFKPPGSRVFSSAKATASKVTGAEAGIVSSALSLFWIVLVVLLVIYLIGVLFEGFGLGALFHLFGFVILVLLILWLLGIV